MTKCKICQESDGSIRLIYFCDSCTEGILQKCCDICSTDLTGWAFDEPSKLIKCCTNCHDKTKEVIAVEENGLWWFQCKICNGRYGDQDSLKEHKCSSS